MIKSLTQYGVSLVEALVALFLVSLVLVGVINVMARIAGGIQDTSDHNQMIQTSQSIAQLIQSFPNKDRDDFVEGLSDDGTTYGGASLVATNDLFQACSAPAPVCNMAGMVGAAMNQFAFLNDKNPQVTLAASGTTISLTVVYDCPEFGRDGRCRYVHQIPRLDFSV